MKHPYRAMLAWLLVLCLCAGLMAGCGNSRKDGRLTVVVTVFPVYDWVRSILGDRADQVNLVLLEKSGADLHNYQPTVEDIATIAACDVFVYVGGESDAWVDDALRQATNPNMVVLNLLELLGDAAREEALLEGMECQEAEEDAMDEHIWLSPKNALLLCEPIAQALGKADPEHQGDYDAACQAYRRELEALDRDYTAVTEAAENRVLLFADRYPFLYLVEDYGLTAYAAFTGCSAETEASFSMITFLAGKVDELGLQYVMVLEGSNRRLAETVISESHNSGAEILTLNSMQSVNQADINAGATYLSIMEENLEVLRTALEAD